MELTTGKQRIQAMPESQPDPESENGFSRAQAASEAQVQAEFWKCWSSFLGMRRTMKEKEKKFFFFKTFLRASSGRKERGRDIIKIIISDVKLYCSQILILKQLLDSQKG